MTTCPNCGLPSEDGSEILRCPKCLWTKEFMNYTEFAKLLCTSHWTVRRWEKQGRIKVVRISAGNIRIHRSEYDRITGLSEENAE